MYISCLAEGISALAAVRNAWQVRNAALEAMCDAANPLAPQTSEQRVSISVFGINITDDNIFSYRSPFGGAICRRYPPLGPPYLGLNTSRAKGRVVIGITLS